MRWFCRCIGRKRRRGFRPGGSSVRSCAMRRSARAARCAVLLLRLPCCAGARLWLPQTSVACLETRARPQPGGRASSRRYAMRRARATKHAIKNHRRPFYSRRKSWIGKRRIERREFRSWAGRRPLRANHPEEWKILVAPCRANRRRRYCEDFHFVSGNGLLPTKEKNQKNQDTRRLCSFYAVFRIHLAKTLADRARFRR